MVTKLAEDRRQEIDKTVTEIIDLIDRWHLVSPFSFVDVNDGHPGEYIGFAEQPVDPFEQWRSVLFPTTIEEEIRLHERYTGFVVGVLCGMRSAGISRDELLNRARGFIIQAVGKARFEAEQMAGVRRCG